MQTAEPTGCTLEKWDKDCKFTETEGTAVESRYIANYEDFTIRFRHGVRGELVNKSGVSTGFDPMAGTLQTQTGRVLREWPGDDFVGQRQDVNRSGMCIRLHAPAADKAPSANIRLRGTSKTAARLQTDLVWVCASAQCQMLTTAVCWLPR